MKTICLLSLIIFLVFSAQNSFAIEFKTKYPPENKYPISLNKYLLQQDEFKTRDFYLQKSKNKKTTAWILLGTGTAMAIGGAIAFDDSWDHSSEYTKTDIFGFITFGGIIADLISIPFFISAAKNKKKALSVSFVMPNNHPPTNKTLNLAIQPVLKIKF